MPFPPTRRLCFLLAIVVAATLAAPTAFAQVDQRRLVTAATVTLTSFLSDPNMTWLTQNFGRAKAVMIAPEITKASIIVGGAGGRVEDHLGEVDRGHTVDHRQVRLRDEGEPSPRQTLDQVQLPQRAVAVEWT